MLKPWMRGQQHRKGGAVERAEQAEADVAIVGIFRAMDRAETIAFRHQPEIGRLRRLAVPQHLTRQLEDVVHGIADEAQPIGSETLPRQIAHRLARTDEAHVRQMVGDDAVRLLGHRGAAIEAFAALDMQDRHAEMPCDQRARDGRVGVAIDQQRVGLFGVEHLAQRRHHAADLVDDMP